MDRAKAKANSVSGSAVSIHGLLAVASALHAGGGEMGSTLAPLTQNVTTESGAEVDYFSHTNTVWKEIGVLVESEDTKGSPRLGIRTSFQSRDAMATELLRRLRLSVPNSLRQK